MFSVRFEAGGVDAGCRSSADGSYADLRVRACISTVDVDKTDIQLPPIRRSKLRSPLIDGFVARNSTNLLQAVSSLDKTVASGVSTALLSEVWLEYRLTFIVACVRADVRARLKAWAGT